MFPFSRKKPSIRHTDDQADTTPSIVNIVSVPRSERWRIHYRLQELKIPCRCLPDGSLQVEIHSSTSALLLRSVMQQFMFSRQETVNWLERCWQIEIEG